MNNQAWLSLRPGNLGGLSSFGRACFPTRRLGTLALVWAQPGGPKLRFWTPTAGASPDRLQLSSPLPSFGGSHLEYDAFNSTHFPGLACQAPMSS